jgi:Ca2+-transporting ATPase
MIEKAFQDLAVKVREDRVLSFTNSAAPEELKAALKAADIGVAVGSATDVTKEAADLVLLNDGLSTIVGAIKEGRIAFDNIKKVTVLLLSGSFTAFLLVMASLILGLPLPLSAVQILWGNLVENGLPNFALAFEPGEPDVMDRQPISRSAPVLDSVGKMIVFGIALMRDFLLIGVFYWYYRYAGYDDLNYVRTIVFALLSTDSLFYIFSIKSFSQPIWREDFFDNWYLLFSIGLGFIMIVAAVYLPLFNRFLETVPLSASDAAVVVGIALFDVALIELVKFFYRHRLDSAPTAAVS